MRKGEINVCNKWRLEWDWDWERLEYSRNREAVFGGGRGGAYAQIWLCPNNVPSYNRLQPTLRLGCLVCEFLSYFEPPVVGGFADDCLHVAGPRIAVPSRLLNREGIRGSEFATAGK